MLGLKLGHELFLAIISRQQSTHLKGRGYRFIICQNYLSVLKPLHWNLLLPAIMKLTDSMSIHIRDMTLRCTA